MSVDPLVLLTLPFDMREGDAVPFVMRDAETLPLVIRFPAPLVLGVIILLPSPSPRSSSGRDTTV